MSFSKRHDLLRVCLGLAVVFAIGCARPLAPGAPVAPAGRSTPSKEEPLGLPDPTTFSYAEAATILRRTALMRALGQEDRSAATMELRVIWDDARGRPEEDALLELVDTYLFAAPQVEGHDWDDPELRAAVAKAWFDRAKVDRLRPHAMKARADFESMSTGSWAGMMAMLDGREAAAHYAADDQKRQAALALYDVQIGDTTRAEETVAAVLTTNYACPVVVALAERSLRDNRPDASQWVSAADAAPGEIDPDASDAFEACVVALAESRLRRSDRAGAAAALARIGGREVRTTCNVLHQVIDHVDPTLLEGLLLEGARSERADPKVTWYGCPGILGELAARRGERALAGHLLARAIRDGDDGGEVGRYDYTWTVGVRLGRIDPFGSDGFHRDVHRTLGLARILDEAPTLRLPREQLVQALAGGVEADKEPDGEAAEGEDAEGDAPDGDAEDAAP